MTTPTIPKTGDLSRVIEACDVVMRELDFQMDRLDVAIGEADQQNRGGDAAHLTKVGLGYAQAMGGLRQLKRHLRKRMAERVRQAQESFSRERMAELRALLDRMDEKGEVPVDWLERQFEHPLTELRLIAATEPGRPYGTSPQG